MNGDGVFRSRNQPSGHPFVDTDGDGLCDYVTDFPAVEARCLNGAAEHQPGVGAGQLVEINENGELEHLA